MFVNNLVEAVQCRVEYSAARIRFVVQSVIIAPFLTEVFRYYFRVPVGITHIKAKAAFGVFTYQKCA